MITAGRHEKWPFIVSLVALATTAAALILLLPSQVTGGGVVDPWVLAGLGVVALVGAAGVVLWRPRPRADGSDARA